MTRPPSPTHQKAFCTFYVDQFLFGVDMDPVREVIRTPAITPVPQASQAVQGLINLRGEIVAAMDLRRLLVLSQPSRGQTDLLKKQNSLMIILQVNKGIVGFLIDQIADVLHVGEDAFEPPPETLPAAARQWISGIYKLQTKLLMVLDVEPLLRTVSHQEEQHG